MGLIWNNDDQIQYTSPEEEILCRHYGMGITDIDDFGCEVTANERVAIFAMKQRLNKRIAKDVEEEIKRCVYKIKTVPLPLISNAIALSLS